MSPEVAELFRVLVELPPEERARYLDTTGVDATTRREVEELLAHDSTSHDSLLHLVGSAAKNLLHSDHMGARCGPFQLVSVLGRGGMGVVYLAERVDGEVTQQAAVKLMQPGWSEVQRERFLQEREILAALTHPNIAHLLDAGHLEDGQPYLAMEYVAGIPIDLYCKKLSDAEKMALFLKVCSAVAYLHANSIIHRDLKPGNILVQVAGEPKLLDFGIAKMLDFGDPTVTHLRMLTPAYASPEQVSGGVVGTRSDIYSLGAVLRHLLTEVKGDIELVLQTATRHDPEERYATVAEFADDLQACLDSRPIRARKGNWAYRTRKFMRRYRGTVALTAIALSSTGGLVWRWSRPVSTIQELKPRRLTANTPELPIQSAAISPDGKSFAYSDPLGVHLQDISSGETHVVPQVEWMPVSDLAKISPDGKRRATLDADRQRLLIDGREVWKNASRMADVFQWSPDNKQVALLSSERGISTLETIDAGDGHSRVLVPADKNLAMNSMVWPSEDRIIVAVRERSPRDGINSPGGSNLWEVRPNAELRRLTAWTDIPIRSGSLITDGKKMVFIRSFRQRDVYVAELDAKRTRMGTPRRLTLDLGDDYPTAWTRDSKSVILSSDRNGPSAVFRQDLTRQTGERVAIGPDRQTVPRMAPDGKWILFAGREQGKRGLMRAPVGGGKAELLFETSTLVDFRCSVAGPCNMAERQGAETVVSELDLTKGKVREIYRDVTSGYATPDISPDGKWLATAWGKKVVVRSYSTGAVEREIPVAGNLVSLDYAPDGKGFFSGDFSSTESRLLYIEVSGKATVLWRQAGSLPLWGVPSPDGKYVAMMMYTDDSNVYVVDEY